jgi:3-oxoisoapionate kinase
LKPPKPSRLLYAYYGDDFTGSTDVLEALALHGVPAVLFTRLPERRDLAAFPGVRAIGIAGESRGHTPAWMDRSLPEIFAAMRRLGARVNQYKVCSTFDSSPRVGSIGRAMELGVRAFGAAWVPVVVGAPHLGRSVVFANLFAAAQSEVRSGEAHREMHREMHRIDRHPAMRNHPVTPMLEADLRLHLARQTRMRIGLVDLPAFQSGTVRERLARELAAGARAVVFDGVDHATLEETASLLWQQASRGQVFAVGSSGLTYGLLGSWRRAAGTLGLHAEPPAWKEPARAEKILILSGSCSPATARQIRRARQEGFAAIRLRSQAPWEAETRHALRALARGESVILYTALGPEDRTKEGASHFGAPLGALLRKLLLASGVRRILIAGGDTSTHAVKKLGLSALTFVAPLTPGAPLCRGHAPGSPFDGLELVLKGGQIGPDDFFVRVRDGRA